MFTIRNRVISTAFKQAKRDIDMMQTTAQVQSQLFIYTVYTDVWSNDLEKHVIGCIRKNRLYKQSKNKNAQW